MKKITSKVVLTGLALVGAFTLNAQQKSIIKTAGPGKAASVVNNSNTSFKLTATTKESIEQTGYARCLTDEYEKELQNQNPKRFSDAQFEQWLAPHVTKIKALREAGKSPQVVYNIPVVVHVIHNGDAVNTVGNATSENISTAQALSQINVMNNDYRRLMGTPGGANTTGVAVDVEINFCMAQTDPMGNLTNGVNRVNLTPPTNTATPSVTDDWEVRSDVETMKANTQWDPTQYLNMWTFKPGGLPLNQGGMSGVLGYAQFPSNSGLSGINVNGGAANTDGVTATYDAFGTIAEDDGSFIMNATYNLGRTMTHEVGHWLGLRHIWGDGTPYDPTGANGTPQGSCPVDDFCADTPNARAANYSCVSNNNCGSGAEQVQNYMDYTNDACMDTFTQDQKDRMIAVMVNSPRRMELNSSAACLAPTPYVSFAAPTQIINEGTACTFTDVNMVMNIGKAPSANADVVVSGSGSATNGVDYQIIGGNITFPSGSDASQNFTLRIFNDGFVEANESITLSMTVNANGGDALPTTASTLNNVITIVSDDVVPSSLTPVDVYDEDFEDITGWGNFDRDGDTKVFGRLNGLDGYGDIVGQCAFSETDNTILGGSGTSMPDNYFATPAFTIPANASSATVSYAIGSYSPNGSHAEHYSVYFTTIDPFTSWAHLEEFVLENDRTVPAAGTEVRNHDLTAYAGMTGKLVFRHHNSAGVGLLIIDTVNVDAMTGTAVQTALNSSAPTQRLLASSGIVYATDGSTGNVMMDVNNNSGVDYGCVTTSVSRASGPAQMFQVAGTPNYVMGKTFDIAPSTAQAGGNATVKFYFTEAEIVQWETQTGNNRSELMVIKSNGGAPEPVTGTIGAFGTNVTIQGTFLSGIAGTYYFGKATALSVKDNDFALFNVYPNPSNGNVNITLSSSEDVQVSLHDIRGRQVYTKLHNNNSVTFAKTIDFSTMAAGVYLLNVESGSKRATKKLVIQ